MTSQTCVSLYVQILVITCASCVWSYDDAYLSWENGEGDGAGNGWNSRVRKGSENLPWQGLSSQNRVKLLLGSLEIPFISLRLSLPICKVRQKDILKTKNKTRPTSHRVIMDITSMNLYKALNTVKEAK